ncbi:zinc ABC transporter ATP-binding protein ZnuC [Candidatus Sororendozoicomonas aggregata]|uniref:zinc ABC transporter ATP-binding protein ZnuC n=1 Tax=Candidatus Sororendozoicomonas aggregata TaxID=3073239 RepID=UPI002ED36519
MNDALISLHNIGMTFQGRTVLHAISMDVKKGEIVTLIGPNGAGKTTLVRIVLGLQQASAGQRILTRGLRIGYMPQKLQVNGTMPLVVKRFLSLTGSKTADIKSALARTGVGKVIHSPVQSLSGGELQRVLLARALLKKPHLLVLDEPVQGVDASGQKELYQLITELRNENQCAVLMVSHDLHLVMASTDRVVCINQHVCCSGHPHTVKKHPAYLRLFGGDAGGLAVYTHQHDHSHDIHGHITPDQKEGK